MEKENTQNADCKREQLTYWVHLGAILACPGCTYHWAYMLEHMPPKLSNIFRLSIEYHDLVTQRVTWTEQVLLGRKDPKEPLPTIPTFTPRPAEVEKYVKEYKPLTQSEFWPKFWLALHFIAYAFPANPLPGQTEHLHQFFQNLHYALPEPFGKRAAVESWVRQHPLKLDQLMQWVLDFRNGIHAREPALQATSGTVSHMLAERFQQAMKESHKHTPVYSWPPLPPEVQIKIENAATAPPKVQQNSKFPFWLLIFMFLFLVLLVVGIYLYRKKKST